MSKYEFLKENEIIINEECLFNQDWGDYSVLWIWNTKEKVLRTELINGYTNYYTSDFSKHIVNDDDILKEASEYYQLNMKDYNYNKWIGNGTNTYVGCTVVLKRSRKAPNKVRLKVVEYIQGGYDSYYNHHIPALIVVEDDEGIRYSTSVSTIDKVVLGCKPYWDK